MESKNIKIGGADMTTQEDVQMLMKAQRITQTQICKDSGVSRSILSRWLSGKQNITSENLKKIAEALGAEVRIIKK